MECVASLGIRSANRSAFEIFAGWQTTAEKPLPPMSAINVILSGNGCWKKAVESETPSNIGIWVPPWPSS
jgi:hypothetical protein